jgi:two-component system aerobic respiration control sensor histidine kinase ArcB
MIWMSNNNDITRRENLTADPFSLLNIMLDVPGCVYWKTFDGIYKGCNQEFLNMTGLRMDHVIGKTDYDFCWCKEADRLRANDRKVMESGSPQQFEEVVQLASGEKLTYTVIKTPIKDKAGKIVGILGTSVNISLYKQLADRLLKAKEKSEEFNKLKSQFISNMEHDLRTPLSTLESTIANLLRTKEEGIEKQTLAFSLSSIEELKIIINTILDFENQKYGYQVLDEPFKLSHIFASIDRLYQPTAKSKGLELSYDIDSKIPRVLISDEWRIKHILINLVGNSLKFTNEGEVSFSAKLIRHKNQKVLIEFIVEDTGIGIPENKRGVIFERYVRLDPSNKGRYKGTGIGLANVKEYVEQLNGEFKPIQSEMGKGTRIAILIPMKESLDQEMSLSSDEKKSKEDEIEFFYDLNKPQKKTKATESKPIKKPSTKEKTSPIKGTTTVLLVEDSPSAQFMGKTAIQGANCEVEVAGTAEDALKMLKEKDYDLIFADIGLPGMDGIEMTRHIRYNERQAGKHPIPIIGQTANANAENKKAGIEAGMQDLLAKPLTASKVGDILKIYTQSGIDKSASVLVPPAIHNTTIIDRDALLSIWNSHPSFKAVFIDTRSDILSDINDFKTAYQKKDWEQFDYLTRKIRGCFLYFGASRV